MTVADEGTFCQRIYTPPQCRWLEPGQIRFHVDRYVVYFVLLVFGQRLERNLQLLPGATVCAATVEDIRTLDSLRLASGSLGHG